MIRSQPAGSETRPSSIGAIQRSRNDPCKSWVETTAQRPSGETAAYLIENLVLLTQSSDTPVVTSNAERPLNPLPVRL